MSQESETTQVEDGGDSSSRVEVLQATLEYWPGFQGAHYGNTPRVKMLIDSAPAVENFRYERRGSLYYASSQGLARFFYYREPGRGYGGRHFHITMKDGEEVTLKGPWSSNSAVMNEAGFGPCMEVSLTDDPEVWERGHTFYTGAAEIPVLRDALSLISEEYSRSPGGTKYSVQEREEIPRPEVSYHGFALCFKGPRPTVVEVKGERLWGNVIYTPGKRTAPWEKDLGAEQSSIVGM